MGRKSFLKHFQKGLPKDESQVGATNLVALDASLDGDGGTEMTSVSRLNNTIKANRDELNGSELIVLVRSDQGPGHRVAAMSNDELDQLIDHFVWGLISNASSYLVQTNWQP